MEFTKPWYQTGLVKISAKFASVGLLGTSSNTPAISALLRSAKVKSQYSGKIR
jgi:hypothetical protein